MAGSYNTAGLEKNLNFIISDGSTPEHGTDIHYSSAISPVAATGAGDSDGPACDYQALREAAQQLSQKGFALQTVIPVALPAEAHPKRRQNKRSGDWETVVGADGKPEPAYTGKNPSYWQSNGKPQLAGPKDPTTKAQAQVLDRIQTAERLGKPIGLAIRPTPQLVVIDFDLKDYGSQEELDQDWMHLLDLNPKLAETRIERTPGGGVHLYVRPADQMESWRKRGEGFHCSFTTTAGGKHRGEVLAVNRISVCAPTRNGSGPYELVNPKHAYDVVEIQSLEAIGIYAIAKRGTTEPTKKEGGGAFLTNQQLVDLSEESRPAGSSPPELADLIGSLAQAVLLGSNPYGNGKGDRSAQLTGFAKEAYGCENLLDKEGLPYRGSADELIEQAIGILGIEDKWNRVLDSINRQECSVQDAGNRIQRYKRLAGLSSETASHQIPSGPKTQKKPPLQVVLEELATAGASGSDLSFKLEKIAGDYDRSLRDVQVLYEELVKEKEAALDADDSLDQLEQLSATGGLDVLSLIPPVLANALEGIRHSAEFQHSTLLAVLLAGFSAALPLRSWIELDPAEDFCQPLTLWVLLLMPSGELKSPLLNRLLVKPWQESVDEVVEQAHRQRVEEWKIAKQAADNGDGPAPGPKPRLPQTLVTEDATVQGLELHMEIHDRWANRSICLWLDEAAAALRQMADPARAGKDASLGGWLLSRYDGTGARGAKVDETRERHYKSCRLAMVAGCQPDVYREITGDADQSGLSARFIVVEQLCVDQRFPVCWTEEEVQRAEDLRKLLVRCYGVLARTEELHLRLTPEAFALFQAERAAMYQRKRASISAAERSLANKAAGRIGRLAALFHLLWCVAEREEGPISLRQEVGVEAMQRAIRFNRFLLDQTLGVRLTSAGNNALGALMLKLQRVAWEKRTPLALSELRRALSGRQRPEMGEVLHAVQRLEERGYGVLESQEYRGQQGWRYTAKRQLLLAS
jgi:hypothetical protein